LVNVAKSSFSHETTIKEIASHDWEALRAVPHLGGTTIWVSQSKRGTQVLLALLDNPNLTPGLLEWLDGKAVDWSLGSQHSYWNKRYGIERRNSNYTRGEKKIGPTRSFSPGLLDSTLEFEEASRAVLEMSDHFAEQLWHDLAKQGHVHLQYSNSEDGDSFKPIPVESASSFSDFASRVLSPGYFVSWIDKDERLDVVYARELLETDDGLSHFEDEEHLSFLEKEPFSVENLGYAIGAGLQMEDIKLLNEQKYIDYLDEIFLEHPEMNNVVVSIISDTPWQGARYRDLDEVQQMKLVSNIVSTLKHPYLGHPDGISVHLLTCIAMHNQSSNPVKAFVLANLPN
jgi:hypothetical protein